MLKRRVNHDSPTTSKDLRYSGRIHPRSPATTELFNHLGDFSLGDERVQPRVPSLCFQQGMRYGRTEKILEVLLPPSDNVPSRGQQLPASTVNSVGDSYLIPTKVKMLAFILYHYGVCIKAHL
ncbi:hypothetical protein ILYODFUR_021313 [Ilyodon furcidens]|uniref:Uncharacterized protein n=1 Tax=Ilyodon furcidens TaxID=33524 RepID=A0ABV0UVD9_9TELE